MNIMEKLLELMNFDDEVQVVLFLEIDTENKLQ